MVLRCHTQKGKKETEAQKWRKKKQEEEIENLSNHKDTQDRHGQTQTRTDRQDKTGK